MKKYMKKIVQGGPLIVETIYPITERNDLPAVRSAKSKITTIAKQASNIKRSKLQLELLIAQNFKEGDYILTFTYDEKHLPKSGEQILNHLRYFRKKLLKSRVKAGYSKADCIKMVWAKEHFCDHGRWHVHAILNKLDTDDLKEIAKCWIYGSIDSSRLKINEKLNFDTLAYYISKEWRDNPGDRIWSHTKNLKAPEVEYQRLCDVDCPLNPPDGSLVLHSASSESFYCFFKVIKYVLPGFWTHTSRIQPIEPFEEIIYSNSFL